MTGPTDAELLAEWDRVSHIADAGQRRLSCLHAVLAKWGTPPSGAGEPVAWRVHPFDYGIGSQGVYAITPLPQQRDAWLRKGWKAEPLYTTQQPTQAQAVAVPLTTAQKLDLISECKGMGGRVGDAQLLLLIEHVEMSHGIKGGQHGAE